MSSSPCLHSSWHGTFYIAGYSPSQLPLSCYPCTTSVHVVFIPQMLSLVWLFSLVVSCNSLQECGSSQEAMHSALQVSSLFWKAKKETGLPWVSSPPRSLTPLLLSWKKYKRTGSIHPVLTLLCHNNYGWPLPSIVAFASYGCFWMSYAAILIPGTGIVAAYSDPRELSSAIGLYLIVWFMFTVMLMYVYSFFFLFSYVSDDFCPPLVVLSLSHTHTHIHFLSTQSAQL